MNGVSRSSSPAPVAMAARISANSPRETSVVAMSAAMSTPYRYRRATRRPAIRFIARVSATATATGPATEAMSPGSMASPKAKKKIAAKASLRGCTRVRIRGAAGVPATIRPTMNAPMASTTPSTSETPATKIAVPRKVTTSSCCRVRP
ncbi:hypothetical protein SHIRM173S_10289 [Streptomyces hirsutus]